LGSRIAAYLVDGATLFKQEAQLLLW